jgi:hypothetical protein
MHKIQRSKVDGKYHIKGKTYDKLVGKRAEVGHGNAYKTAGGLTVDDLVYVKGRWKSKIKYETAKKELRLQKHGYFTEKGKFGYVKKSKKVKPLQLNLEELDKLKESSSKRLHGIRLPAPQRIPSPHSPSYYGSKYKSRSYKKSKSRNSKSFKKSNRSNSSNRSNRSSRSNRSNISSRSK